MTKKQTASRKFKLLRRQQLLSLKHNKRLNLTGMETIKMAKNQEEEVEEEEEETEEEEAEATEVSEEAEEEVDEEEEDSKITKTVPTSTRREKTEEKLRRILKTTDGLEKSTTEETTTEPQAQAGEDTTMDQKKAMVEEDGETQTTR